MNTQLKKRITTSIFLIALLVSMYVYSFMMMVSLIIIAIIVWIEFYGLISKIITDYTFKNRIKKFLCKSISLLYLSLLVYFVLSIVTYYPALKMYLFYSTLITILSDIGGLVFGKIFKGIKLTKISPQKTVSGSIGSFIFSLCLVPFFYGKLLENNFFILILFTILISLVSQLGDLLISYLKRRAKVKDTSDLLPGHGGFLDRVDGLIFAAPFGTILLNLI